MATTQALLVLARRWVTSGDGRATLRNLRGVELTCRTLDEAEQLADLLSAALPEPMRCRLGLFELMLNAIEHGNLEIDVELKSQLLRDNCFDAEVAGRLAREPYRSRSVHVTITEVEPSMVIEIRDDGPGFDWRRALARKLDQSDAPNGRGIALIRASCFPDLAYRDPGNVAIVRLAWPD